MIYSILSRIIICPLITHKNNYNSEGLTCTMLSMCISPMSSAPPLIYTRKKSSHFSPTNGGMHLSFSTGMSSCQLRLLDGTFWVNKNSFSSRNVAENCKKEKATCIRKADPQQYYILLVLNNRQTLTGGQCLDQTRFNSGASSIIFGSVSGQELHAASFQLHMYSVCTVRAVGAK